MQETYVRRTYCPETWPERHSALKGLWARFVFNIPTRRVPLGKKSEFWIFQSNAKYGNKFWPPRKTFAPWIRIPLKTKHKMELTSEFPFFPRHQYTSMRGFDWRDYCANKLIEAMQLISVIECYKQIRSCWNGTIKISLISTENVFIL